MPRPEDLFIFSITSHKKVNSEFKSFQNPREAVKFLLEVRDYLKGLKETFFCGGAPEYTGYKTPSDCRVCKETRDTLTALFGDHRVFNRLPFVRYLGDREFEFFWNDAEAYANSETEEEAAAAFIRLAEERNTKMSLKERAIKFSQSPRIANHYGSISESVENDGGETVFFILQEIIDGMSRGFIGNRSPRGIQYRYTLYRITRDKKEPDIIFEDHAWSGSPEQEGRNCHLGSLAFEDEQVRVTHNTSTYGGKKITKILYFSVDSLS